MHGCANLMKEIIIPKRASFDINIVQFPEFCLQDQASALLVTEYLP